MNEKLSKKLGDSLNDLVNKLVTHIVKVDRLLSPGTYEATVVSTEDNSNELHESVVVTLEIKGRVKS